MPGPKPPLVKQQAKNAFRGKGLVLPEDWDQPTGPEGRQYVDAFKPSELAAAHDPQCLFAAATPNKYHVDTAHKIGRQFATYIDGIVGAVCQAWDLWRLQAKFQGLIITGPSATGAPGCLMGPTLEPMIMMNAPKATPNELRYSKAIAKAVSDGWQRWQMGVSVPGLPWYPAFAAMPTPVAPPTPNVPTPLASCPSAAAAEMTAPRLSQGMAAALGGGGQHSGELFDSVADAVAQAFTQWLPQQQIMNVMGYGPVPTCAPPLVPVGPVTGGTNIPAPGHLAT
jgi:hypothetical protein